MLYNYLRVALRNLSKNRFYATITITSLALGLACVSVIIQFLKHELSYDRFHNEAENIYRIAWEDENPQTRTPHPMAQALVQDFPEVQSAVSITSLWGFGLTKENFSFRNPEKEDIRFDESNILAVDSTFFDVFTFPLVKGDPKKALKNPDGILLSTSMATKYFGDDEPIGKHLAVNDEKSLVEVVGVFEDVPPASHFHFDFLISYVREKSLEDPESLYYTWKDFGHYNYIRLQPGTNAAELEAKLGSWIRKYIELPDDVYESLKAKNYGFRLQPITDIHLHSHLRWELEPNGHVEYIYMMAGAAFLILFIACVNFINLTTAQSSGRTKEVGIRKSLGAFRHQLILQFTGESLLISFIAMILAIAIIEVSLPFVPSAWGMSLERNYHFFALALTTITLASGVLAGIFPSLYLASAKPAAILKSKSLQPVKGWGLREAFIVFQFCASMMLITCSIIIYQQLRFIQEKDLGFQQEEVIILPVKKPDAINPRFDELRNELQKIQGVVTVSAASNVPGKNYNQNPVFPSSDPQVRIATSESFVDYEFFDALNIQFAAGRPFLKQNPADQEAFILNETAAKNIYAGDALGKELSWDFDEGIVKGTVVGVVKDFHFQSLHEPVRPLLFRLAPWYNYVIIKIQTDDVENTIKAVTRTWKTFDDQFAFEFAFLSDYLNDQYRQEQSMATILGVFAVVAVAIASFGLFAIAALTFRQKTKEVSIRKVLGATMTQIVVLLIGSFTRIVLIAIALAVPLAWFVMNNWLEKFTFRTTINPMLFAVTGIMLVLIAWATLSYLLWNTSKLSPAETLKTE